MSDISQHTYYKYIGKTTGNKHVIGLPGIGWEELLIIVQGASDIYHFYSTIVPKEIMRDKTTYWRFGTQLSDIVVTIFPTYIQLHKAIIENIDYAESTTIYLYCR